MAERGQHRLVGGQDQLDQVAVESALWCAVSAAAAMASSLSPSSSATSVTCTADPLAAASSRTPNSAERVASSALSSRSRSWSASSRAAPARTKSRWYRCEELGRLGVQAQLVAVGVQLVDPGEEGAIQGDRVGVGRQPGGVLGLDRLQLGVGVGRGQAPEHPAYAVEDPAGALQRDDRVREGGRGVAVGDHLDLGQLLGHPGVQTGPEVLDRDVGERRQLVRQVAGGEERVVRAGLGDHRASLVVATTGRADTDGSPVRGCRPCVGRTLRGQSS